ncbi:MAG: hypothetical protein QOJ82_2051 [Solirubrobacteraceae bacterium]|jgi:hypothetical protein|nr:hypothetical protein [Solirubrobacteraceae bacterium]
MSTGRPIAAGLRVWRLTPEQVEADGSVSSDECADHLRRGGFGEEQIRAELQDRRAPDLYLALEIWVTLDDGSHHATGGDIALRLILDREAALGGQDIEAFVLSHHIEAPSPETRWEPLLPLLLQAGVSASPAELDRLPFTVELRAASEAPPDAPPI